MARVKVSVSRGERQIIELQMPRWGAALARIKVSASRGARKIIELERDHLYWYIVNVCSPHPRYRPTVNVVVFSDVKVWCCVGAHPGVCFERRAHDH